MFPTFIGAELQSVRLIFVLSDHVPTEQYIYAVRLPNRHLPTKVRVFIDFLLARFGDDPYWDRIEVVDRANRPRAA